MPFPVQAKKIGVPVKDYISQGAIFTICIFFIARFAFDYWRAGHLWLALALAGFALIFLANIFYVATSRTSLVVVVILLVVFGYKQFGLKGAIGLLAGFLILGAAAWPSAGFLQSRVISFWHEVQSYHPDAAPTPAGERLEFWRKSIGFIEASPIIGHGTGSIREQFSRAVIGNTGMGAEVSTNPHNQILAIGIQLGFVGIAILLAMWIAHLKLFRSDCTVGWIGLVLVIQNIVGSLFNSHLADFTHGWIYVVGVGVAGGNALRQFGAKPTPT
jgi:O-antigen ligase